MQQSARKRMTKIVRFKHFFKGVKYFPILIINLMNADSARWTLLRHGEFGNQNLCKGGNTKKMKKKTLTIAIALVLVVALAVGATWALLTHTTDTVTNTFVVGKLIDGNTTFSLKEHAIDMQDATGRYVLKTGDADSDYTTRNTYGAVVPGVNIPKDPTVKVEKLAGDAYLYVVVDNQLGTGLSYTVDGKWTKLANNGTKALYVYNGGEKLTANSIVSQGVLANNEIVVGETVADGSTTLSFNAYLVQAVGTGDAAAAWNAAAPVAGFMAVMP